MKYNYKSYEDFLLEEDGGGGNAGGSSDGGSSSGLGDASTGTTLGDQGTFYTGTKGSGDKMLSSAGLKISEIKDFQKKTKKLKTGSGKHKENDLKSFLTKAKL